MFRLDCLLNGTYSLGRIVAYSDKWRSKFDRSVELWSKHEKIIPAESAAAEKKVEKSDEDQTILASGST